MIANRPIGLCATILKPGLLPTCTLLFFLLPAAVFGQAFYPTPRLTSLDPSGGKLGTRVEVTVNGFDLDDASGLYFSDARLKATRLPAPKPVPDKKGSKKTPAGPEPIRFEVVIPNEAPPGLHDVRVIGKWGISNPRAFAVGELPEVSEKEKNDDVPEAMAVPMNSVVNGVIGTKTDVDYFKFQGKKGQKVVIHCAASSIDSRLLAYLQLFSSDNRELGSNKNYRDRDAVLSAVLPDDGDYLIRLCEFAYQNGGPESFYRLTISDGPWIDAVYPAAFEPGKELAATLYGKNLPGSDTEESVGGIERIESKFTPTAQGDMDLSFPGRLLPRLASMEGVGYRIKSAKGHSNAAFVSLSTLPITLDNKTNDDAASAQEIIIPCTICGQVEKRGDRDFYVFDAKKGETFYIEAFGDRLRAPVDLYFHLRNVEKNQMIGVFDDHPGLPTSVDRFFTHTDDAQAKFVAPQDGRYELMVRSRTAEFRGGPRQVYRVDLRKPTPDYRLVVVGNHENGAGLTLRRGGSQDIRLICLRQDEFEGEIMVQVEGLPAGITCPPQVIGPKVNEAVLVLSASSAASDWAGEIKIQGTAQIDGKEVVREARTGCLVYPTANANQPALSRLCRSICMAVREKGPFHLDTPHREVSLPVGGPASFKIKVARDLSDFKDNVQIIAAAGPVQPNGKVINFPKLTVGPDKEGEMKVTLPTNTPPGTYSLVFRGSGKINRMDDKKKKANVTFTSVTPPVRLTVFDTVAKLSIPQRIALKPGGEQILAVNLERLHGYKGDFQIELVKTSGSGGISAANVTVPAGSTEGKLILKAAKDAKPAMLSGFLVRATAKFDKVSLKEEAKLQIDINKEAAVADTPTDVKTIKILDSGAAGWRYHAAKGLTGDAWRDTKFDDARWQEGKAPLGNGEDEIKTRNGTEVALKGGPILCRREFEIAPDLLKDKGARFMLYVASDNSATVYINGKMVDDDKDDHEFSYWNREVAIPSGVLQAGKNLIAIEVHNSEGSSDLYLDASVVAQVPKKK